MPFEQVRRWAAAAQVAPHDKLSHDQQSWLKAPMFPELEMDWLIEVTSERYYGPTTLGALREFLQVGEIGEETFVINSCDGSRRQIKELAGFFQLPARPNDDSIAGSEAASLTSTMAINLSSQISELERSLFEERRALQECEARCREFEARYHALREERL